MLQLSILILLASVMVGVRIPVIKLLGTQNDTLFVCPLFPLLLTLYTMTSFIFQQHCDADVSSSQMKDNVALVVVVIFTL